MKKIAALSVMATAGMAMGNDVFVDLTGLASMDGQGEGTNVVLMVDLGVPNAEVTGISWELGYEPISPSWTSEPHLTYGDSAGSNAYDWDMGDWGGTNNSDPVFLAGSDTTSFFVGGDGMLRIELWEDFNDFAGAPDGFYTQGGVNVTFTPAPASLALLGMGGLVATRRRR